MSNTCPAGYRSDAVVVAALEKLWVVTPDDIKSHWMDLMVKRLLRELNRQLLQIENEKADESRPHRAENARVLASLEQTLERLARLEAQRAAIHQDKKKQDAKKRLEHTVDRIAAAEKAAADSEKPEQ